MRGKEASVNMSVIIWAPTSCTGHYNLGSCGFRVMARMYDLLAEVKKLPDLAAEEKIPDAWARLYSLDHPATLHRKNPSVTKGHAGVMLLGRF